MWVPSRRFDVAIRRRSRSEFVAALTVRVQAAFDVTLAGGLKLRGRRGRCQTPMYPITRCCRKLQDVLLYIDLLSGFHHTSRYLTDASRSAEQCRSQHDCSGRWWVISTACYRLPDDRLDIQLHLALASCRRWEPFGSRQRYLPRLLGLVSLDPQARRRHRGCWPLHPVRSSPHPGHLVSS